MTGKRVLGMLGLDAAGRLVARRALESGVAVTMHAPEPGAAEQLASLGEVRVASNVEDVFIALERPRALLLCLPSYGGATATSPVDSNRAEFLRRVIGGLDRGDLLMTTSPGSWAEHEAVAAACSAAGLDLVDLGASLGAERRGTSLLTAGGGAEAWERARAYLGSGDRDVLVGRSGAGVTTALVRAALDGLLLELTAEIYHILKSAVRMSYDEMRMVFAQWNAADLADPLVAATADALGLRDEDGAPLLEKVLDASFAASGPCARAAAIALDAGVPAPMTSQAAAATALASMKDARIDASAVLSGPKAALTGERGTMIEELRKAFLASTILASAESFSLLGAASSRRRLGIDLVRVSRLWADAEGSRILGRAADAIARSGGRANIVLDAPLKLQLDQSLPSLRRVAGRAIEGGVPVPALSAALSFYDCYRSTWLPANLANAIKDSLLGSGFERIDRPRGELFHSDWR